MKIGWGRTGESQNSFCSKLWRYPFLTQAKEDFHMYYVVTPLNAFNLPWGLSGASDCIDFVITAEQKHDECASFQHSMSSHGIDITSGFRTLHAFVCSSMFLWYANCSISNLRAYLASWSICNKRKFSSWFWDHSKIQKGKKKNYPQTWEGKSNQGGILKEIIWMSMFLYLFILFNMKHELCWYTFYVSRGQTVLCFEQRAVWEVNISCTTSHSTPPNFSFQEPLQLA